MPDSAGLTEMLIGVAVLIAVTAAGLLRKALHPGLDGVPSGSTHPQSCSSDGLPGRGASVTDLAPSAS